MKIFTVLPLSAFCSMFCDDLYADANQQPPLVWWAWLLIAIVVAIILAGAAFAYFELTKKYTLYIYYNETSCPLALKVKSNYDIEKVVKSVPFVVVSSHLCASGIAREESCGANISGVFKNKTFTEPLSNEKMPRKDAAVYVKVEKELKKNPA